MDKVMALGCAFSTAGLLAAGLAQAQPAPTLWITDDGTKNLYQVTTSGSLLRAPFRPPVGATSGLAIDPVNGTFWAAREGLGPTAGVVNFSRTGATIGVIPRTAFGAASALEGVATDPSEPEVLWVIDDPVPLTETAVVYKVTTTGVLLDSFERPLPANSPQAIAIDPFDGTLWITDNRQDRIYNVSTDGVDISSFPTSSFDASSTNPQGITVDGNDGTLWITDRTTKTLYNVTGAGALVASFTASAYELAASVSPVGIALERDDDGSGGADTVRDEFSAASYGNNDGTANWAGDWIENDPDGQSPGSGQVAIVNGELTLEDRPDSGQQPGLRRRADLSGADSAIFSFDFVTTASVDSSDAITVDVSDNGGSSWTVLEVFTGISGASSGSRSYDISSFASASTEVRFRITNLYGGDGEFFNVDNVQIAYEAAAGEFGGTARDNFDSVSYSNSDGNLQWAGDWVEDDAFGGGAGTGQVAIENNELTLEDRPNTGTEPGLSRRVNLGGTERATLSFTFGTTGGVDASDAVVVDVSGNGGSSWNTLETFTGIVGSGSGSRCYDITAFATANTRIRLRVTNLYGGRNESFLVDDVAVVADAAGC